MPNMYLALELLSDTRFVVLLLILTLAQKYNVLCLSSSLQIIIKQQSLSCWKIHNSVRDIDCSGGQVSKTYFSMIDHLDSLHLHLTKD